MKGRGSGEEMREKGGTWVKEKKGEKKKEKRNRGEVYVGGGEKKKKKKKREREQRERGEKLRKVGILEVVKKINILKNGIVMFK
jgi:hypothetical protein